MSIPETLLYTYYLFLVYSHGTQLQATRGRQNQDFLLRDMLLASLVHWHQFLDSLQPLSGA